MMKEINLPELGIKVLLKCQQKARSKHDITQLFKPYTMEERTRVLQQLLDEKYIESVITPKPNTKKSPTYYFITEKGIKWIENYLALINKN